jgi:hypothetical protein
MTRAEFIANHVADRESRWIKTNTVSSPDGTFGPTEASPQHRATWAEEAASAADRETDLETDDAPKAKGSRKAKETAT